MEKLVVEFIAGPRSLHEFKVFEKPVVKLGRSLDNDLIINDEYASLKHAEITIEGQQIRIKDLGSINGILISEKQQRVQEVIIVSGQLVMIGRTRLRIYLSSHPFPEARSFMSRNKIFEYFKSPMTTVLLLLFIVSLELWSGYCMTENNKDLYKILGSQVILILVFVFVWAGFWVFIGRLIRHKISVVIHVSIACLLILFYWIFDNLVDQICFYTHSSAIQYALSSLMYAVTSIIILFCHLTFSTYLSNRARLIVSSLLTAVFMAFFVGAYFLSENYEESYLSQKYYKNLEPLVWKGNVHSLEDWIEKSDLSLSGR